MGGAVPALADANRGHRILITNFERYGDEQRRQIFGVDSGGGWRCVFGRLRNRQHHEGHRKDEPARSVQVRGQMTTV